MLWLEPALLARVDEFAQFVLSLHVRNACLVIRNASATQLYQSKVLAAGEDSDDAPGYAVLHGWSDFTYGYQRLLISKTNAEWKRTKSGPLPENCARRPGTAIGVPFSLNNIWHATFHAVPLMEEYRGAAGPITYFPLLYRQAELGAVGADPRRWHAWEYTLRALSSRSAEQMADDLRPLLSARLPGSRSVQSHTDASHTSHLTASARISRAQAPGCTCFDALRASAPPFNLRAKYAAGRLRVWVAASLANAERVAAAAAASSGDGVGAHGEGEGEVGLLYVHRATGRRALSPANEAKLRRALRRLEQRQQQQLQQQPSSPTASQTAPPTPLLRRVVLERLPMHQQARLVARARGLVGVFGQSLAWMIFLPWTGGRSMGGHRATTAVVEIVPKEGLWNYDYVHMARNLGVRHWRVRADIDPGSCDGDGDGEASGGGGGGGGGGGTGGAGGEDAAPRGALRTRWKREAAAATRFKTCNLTVSVPRAVAAVAAALTHCGLIAHQPRT